MSQKLISLSNDLKRLRDEGYEIEVKRGHALIHHVPYVNSSKEVRFGTMVSNLTLSGNVTTRPDTHVMYFFGEYPCNKDGQEITAIKYQSITQTLMGDITVNHSFSSKPNEGYADYYEKFTTYINIISSHAQFIDPSVTSKTFRPMISDEESVFHYHDTNSSRSNVKCDQYLENQKIAIIGLGGSGSYILDFIAKTPVSEIHLYDIDDFLQHNAFRAPGAAPIKILRDKPKKVHYWQSLYGNMHKYIYAHPENVDETNISNLSILNFVFIAIDNGVAKKLIIDHLLSLNIPFIDVGIGIQDEQNRLYGQIRTTLVTPEKSDHIKHRINFKDGANDAYSSNIQIAELNAMNAALAVVKWKKYLGFYHDHYKEHNMTYTLDTGEIINEDRKPNNGF